MVILACVICALILVAMMVVCLSGKGADSSTVINNHYTHIHLKTGRKYREVMHATLEASLVELVVYEGEDGEVWARPTHEFDDPERFSLYV